MGLSMAPHARLDHGQGELDNSALTLELRRRNGMEAVA
jgi:hypothetical protein